jgi:putative ABC transport system permease protein
MAVRAALGASTGRLLRQLLVEAGVLAIAGGIAGCAVAWGLVWVLGGWIAGNLSPLVEVRPDGAAFGFAALLTAATTTLLALAPAREGHRAGLAGTLRRAGRDGAAGGGNRGARLLVFTQVALTTVLLVGAGLMLRTVERLARRDVGFPTAGILTFQLDLTGARYAEPEARVAFAQRFEAAAVALPGVREVALLGPARLARATWVVRLRPAERPAASPEDYTMLFRHSVNANALSRLGIPLLRGRELDERDHAGAPLVAVVSETVAEEMWPGQDPLGRQLLRPDATLPPITVVGVAGDVKHRDRYSLDDVSAGFPLAASGPQRDVYLPYAQRANPTQTWALRFDGDLETTLAGVRRVAGAIDPDVPVAEPTLLDDRLAAQEGTPKALASLLAAFAAFGLLLGGVGVYGVVAETLRRRRRELGMRMALGANPSQLTTLVVATGALPALAGAAVGLLGSLAMGPSLAALLVDVRATDPLTLATVPLVLLLVALAAAAGPARRVLRGDPLRALRAA